MGARVEADMSMLSRLTWQGLLSCFLQRGDIRDASKIKLKKTNKKRKVTIGRVIFSNISRHPSLI
jgi:hypothetical protein